MATKINGSFVPRGGIARDWAQAVNFVPAANELIVYSPDTEVYSGNGTTQGKSFTYESATYTRFKFGDGKTNVNLLPFATGGVGEAIANGGEIFNDYENNEANTLYSHAEGNNTLAGAKVFWAESGSAENKTYTLDSVEGIEVGDYYSYKCVPNESAGITYNGTFDFWGTITAINENTVTVSDFVRGQNNAFQSGYFWIPRKPTIGTIIPELELWQHTEGSNTRAIMGAGHAEGNNTVASGRWSHAEGKGTIAGYGSHAEGRGTEARGLDSHSEGFHTVAKDSGAHAEGDHTVAKGNGAHAEGIGKTSNVKNTFAGGMRPDETYGALATAAHSEGYQTRATATAAHSEGKTTIASGSSSHAEGTSTKASGSNSHTEGDGAQATAENAHAEGGITVANGNNSHAEGLRSIASGGTAHAEGSDTQAAGARAHTEGIATYAEGFASHAEGAGSSAKLSNSTTQSTYGAFGDYSHSEGLFTKAQGKASHAEGIGTIAQIDGSHAEGTYNKIEEGIISSIGNGTSDSDRSNAFAVYKDGHAEVGKTGDTANSIVTKEYVDTNTQSKVLHGKEAPSPNIGVDGDIYIQIIE